ncbi:MAG: stage II sporulation protein M [Methanobrevibacter millerae]|uniref:Stage II sporulation protein M n=1 Tax=Methanobrevibacter millerae TaxID=230361 RepID=A0A8T3VCT0_9EURY|nr:stage II sporulation protein M [Methanobrevibacter millerae]MBE6504205.1 stage II sporulation protein M [Methanobrevibacter millerae]
MDIKNEIKEAFSENRKIFLLLAILFIINFILGDIFADDISSILIPALREAMLEGNVTSIDAFNIMIHNETAALITFIASIFFAVYAFIAISINGFVIGFMAGYTVKSTQGLIMFLALIVPHGILEIPAFFCSCTSGILLFLFIFRVFKDKIQKNTFSEAYENNKKTIKHALILFAMAVLLFAVAALIEGFITPQIGNIISQQMGGPALL